MWTAVGSILSFCAGVAGATWWLVAGLATRMAGARLRSSTPRHGRRSASQGAYDTSNLLCLMAYLYVLEKMLLYLSI